MPDYARIEETLIDTLQLPRRPVAISFRDRVPDGVPRLEGAQPSGCSFWGLAAEGRTFHTLPEDHYNCPIGSYTHNMPLPADRQQELSGTLGLMSELGYLRMEEVPGIPQLPATPAVTIYAPLGEAPVAPDVVVVTGTPAGLMLLHETALRLGRPMTPMLGRPTCMAVPAALSGSLSSSLGCIGNRVYTKVTDDQFYAMIRGDEIEAFMHELSTITAANVALAEYHRDRQRTISA